jgi:hypothetical protein
MQPDSATMRIVALDSVPRVDVPVASLRGLTGVWRNVERGEVRRTRLAGDTLYFAGTDRTRIVPLGGGRFRAQPGTELRFEGDARAPSRLIVRTTAETVTYSRADTAALAPAALAEYAGDYRSDEVGAIHTWKVEKGQLVLYVNERRLGPLEPTYRDGFARGGTEIDVERDAKGRVAGFVVEAGRVRHLRFTRVR